MRKLNTIEDRGSFKINEIEQVSKSGRLTKTLVKISCSVGECEWLLLLPSCFKFPQTISSRICIGTSDLVLKNEGKCQGNE